MPNEILDKEDQLRRIETLAEAMAKGRGYILWINDGENTQQICHCTGGEMVEMFCTALDNDSNIRTALQTAQLVMLNHSLGEKKGADQEDKGDA